MSHSDAGEMIAGVAVSAIPEHLAIRLTWHGLRQLALLFLVLAWRRSRAPGEVLVEIE